jgi:outer membrane protein assembly factor BamB
VIRNACWYLCTGVVALALGGVVAAENWPQWRGPNHDGVSTEAGLPTTWSATENVAWKLRLPGMGSSTPAVWGDRIFLTAEDGSDLVLLCVGTDGNERWKAKLGTGQKMFGPRRDEANLASASPCTDGKHVWAFLGTGALGCFDFDGKEVWKFNVQDRYGRFRMQWGMHTSPLLEGDRLYLALLHSGGAHVVALDKATGKEVWNVARQSDATAECEQSYASPSLWRNGSHAYLIVHGNDYATAHRLEDGSEIWRVGELNPKDHYNYTLRFVATPVAVPDLIVVPSAKKGPVVGVKPNASGLVMPGGAGEQWRMPHNTPDVPSPLVHDGLVYLCGESGILYCLDGRTGKVLYSHRTHDQRHRASPVLADGKLYLTARDGVFTVVKPGPAFEVIATNKLPDLFTASPAISDGRIYLRGFSYLWAIGRSGR